MVGLAACGAPQVQTEHPLTLVPQFLVTDGLQSALIIDGPEGYEILAKSDRVLIPAASGLWTFDTPVVPRPEADCGCFMEAFNQGLTPSADCTRMVDKPHAKLTRLDDRQTLEPFTEPSSPDSESTTTYQLNGIIDDSLLIRMCTSAYACGAAHPGAWCELAVIDLNTATQQKADVFQLRPDFEKARAELRARENTIEDDTELKITEVRVQLVGTATQIQTLITAPACYACSDNEWGSYSVSVWEKAGPAEELPRPVAAYFQAHPGANIWAPVDAANRNKIEAAFAAR